MSFGFSVGDILTISQLASTIRKQFVDAPDQFKATCDEVKSLSNILRDVEDILPERDLTNKQEEDLYEIIEGCRNVLSELDQVLKEYHVLDTNPKSIANKSRRVWKRLRWEPDTIRDLRLRIISNTGLLNTFNGNLNSKISLATKAGVDRLNRSQVHQERRAIIDWLTPIDFSSQQNDLITRLQKGTGQWVLNSSDFQTWLKTSQQTLFCPGIPGAGKTMITSLVANHLCKSFQNDESIGIAYLYCSHQRQQEQKPRDLLLSLLKQLVQEQSSVPEQVRSLYERYQGKVIVPSIDEVSKALRSVASDYTRVFILIDALDECQVSEEGTGMLLSEVFNLQTKTGANIFTTARLIPEIVEVFKASMSLEIYATDEDVERYLEGHMSQLPSFVARDSSLQQTIKTGIIKAVDGMFLLAKLHMDSLIDKTTVKALKSALQKLPRGLEALDNAYKEAIKRVEAQKEGFRDLAKRVLSWITLAARPLTTLELQYALAVEIGDSELDKDNLPQINDMVSVCAGLVTVDEGSQIIRLVHYTTQEYFKRICASWTPNAQINMTMTCLTYLAFDVFANGPCLTAQGFSTRLRQNPFYAYAVIYWGQYAGAASPRADELILSFLANPTRVASCGEAMITGFDYFLLCNKENEWSQQFTGMHLVVYSGLAELVTTLLKNGFEPDPVDSQGRTPLCWAAIIGNEEMVKLLLLEDSIDVNSRDDLGMTPLAWAAKRGHKSIVQLLLENERTDPNSKDSDGNTPLAWAAIRGTEALVKLLLAKDGIDLNSGNIWGRTPLSLATDRLDKAVLKLLLLEDGIDLNPRILAGWTPLSSAAENGDEDALLSNESKKGWTPLSSAAENGDEDALEMLLSKEGVDPNLKSKKGWTPLSLAIERGHTVTVELLLAKDGIDINSKERDGWTALSLAAATGQRNVVKLLLNKDGVDLNSKNIDGETALTLAARFGHYGVVKLLLAKDGLDLNLKNNYGETALSLAAENGVEAVVGLLLAQEGIDVDSTTDTGEKAHSLAAQNGHDAVVRLLTVDPTLQSTTTLVKASPTPLELRAQPSEPIGSQEENRDPEDSDDSANSANSAYLDDSICSDEDCEKCSQDSHRVIRTSISSWHPLILSAHHSYSVVSYPRPG